jgi:hypothetical protein
VEPGAEFWEVSEHGTALMDGRRAGDAFDAGLRQADAELAEQVGAAGLG